MPISRLSIPRYKKSVPLVEYNSEIRCELLRLPIWKYQLICKIFFVGNSDNDEVSSPFFPSKLKLSKKFVDLSDTFSLQEMTINSDSGEETDDSQNLELLPPSMRKQYANKFINFVCCFNAKV